jgi:hypothetical protein
MSLNLSFLYKKIFFYYANNKKEKNEKKICKDHAEIVKISFK